MTAEVPSKTKRRGEAAGSGWERLGAKGRFEAVAAEDAADDETKGEKRLGAA